MNLPTASTKHYRPSIFNYITLDPKTSDLILYNSLSRTVATVASPRVPPVSDLLTVGSDSPQYDHDDHDAVHFLSTHGFLVTTETDEPSLSRLRYLDQAMSNELFLTILPTEQCNFRCRYCYESFDVGKMPPTIQDGLIRYVRKNISRHTSLHVEWFGGEPLQAPDVIGRLSREFIDICSRNHKPYSSSMTTNGYDLTSSTLDRMYANKIRNFTVTLDGPKESHDKLRVRSDGHPTFDTIVGNLMSIRDSLPRYRVQIVVRTNVSREVYDRLDHHLGMLSREFRDDPRFSFFFRPTEDWGGKAVKSISQDLMRAKDYRGVYEKLIAHDVRLNYQMYLDELTDPDICYAAKRNAYVVGANGRIYKCTVYLDHPRNLIGQITSEGTFDIDERKHAPWISNLEVHRKCTSCTFAAACHGAACPAPAVLDGGINPCPNPKKYMSETLRLVTNRVSGLPRLA